MKHPIKIMRNRKIRKEFGKMYKEEYLTGKMSVEQILSLLSGKYKLSVKQIKRIIYPKGKYF